MNTSQRSVTPCGLEVKAGMVRMWVGGKLCDPLVTHGSYLSAFDMYHDKALYKFALLLVGLLNS